MVSGKPLILAIALLVAGCATRSAHQYSSADEGARQTVVIPELPPIAPPPTSAEERVLQPSITGAVRPTEYTAHTWVSLIDWCKGRDVQVVFHSSAPSLAYEIRSPRGVFTVWPGSQVARWQNFEVRLGFKPQSRNGELWLHALDLEKTIQPLITGSPALSGKLALVIVIDPGHGGANPGTKSVWDGRYEKDFTLDWGRRLATVLESRGWGVFLTRTNDTNLALSNRVAVAEAHNADLFVSLHFNSAAPDRTQSGVETYCLTPAGVPSTVTRGFEDDIGITFPNNAFDEQNVQLACCVHHALLEVNGHQDRAVRRARFLGVLRMRPSSSKVDTFPTPRKRSS